MYSDLALRTVYHQKSSPSNSNSTVYHLSMASNSGAENELNNYKKKLELLINNCYSSITLLEEEKKKMNETGGDDTDIVEKISIIHDQIAAIQIALSDVEVINSQIKLIQTCSIVKEEAEQQLNEDHHVIAELENQNASLRKKLSEAEKKCKEKVMTIADLDSQIQMLTFMNTLPVEECCLYDTETPDTEEENGGKQK